MPTPADSSLLVLPEGIMLNYLTRRPNPTPYHTFMPPELAIFGEKEVLESFQQHPPDYVVLIHKDTVEYGVGFFGQDARYGQRLRQWVDRNYVRVLRILNEPLHNESFGIELWLRADQRGLEYRL